MKILQQIFSYKMLLCLFMGIASGIPLLATGSTLQAWMKSENIDITKIGLFTLTGLPYTLKFLWSPLVDYYAPFGLTRRRGWMFVTQSILILLFIAIGICGPKLSLELLALLTLVTCFASATQDIVLDAYRRDILSDDELGLGSSLFINGYRLGMILSGALALALADILDWRYVYFFIAITMLIGLIVSYIAKEPIVGVQPNSLKQSVIEPLKDFFIRKHAYIFLLFILLYKIGDSMASAMTVPFILELGFTKTDLAIIAKGLGMVATLGGGVLAGIFMLKTGINKALWIFGFFQAISTLSFLLLILYPAQKNILAGVVTFEYLASGMGTAAFAAFMASLTNRSFSATQYALLTSLLGVPRVFAGSTTGYIVKFLGWESFFLICTIVAVPGMYLLKIVAPWKKVKQD